MSRENVEVVRRVYEGWARGDFGAGVDVLDEHVVFVLRPQFPDAGTYLGIERVADYTREFLAPWARITIQAEEITEAESHVVAAVHQQGVGDGSGVPTALRYFQVWSFRGRKVIRLENFRERSEAFEAAGLAE